MRVAARGVLPLPRLDRPELVSIGDNSYTGGGNTLCTRQVDASGATYRQIRIGCDSFVANGTILMPGTSFGPRSVLGNRSLGIAGEDYSDAVFAGQKGKQMPSDISSGIGQPVCIRASPVRLWKIVSMKPSKRPFQAQNEGSSIATLLLVFLCTALLQSVDVLIALATLLFERQLLWASAALGLQSLSYSRLCARRGCACCGT